MGKQHLGLFDQRARRCTVAGRPVVDAGQKPLGGGEAGVKVADAVEQKAVQVVFFIIGVRQLGEKRIGGRRAAQRLCQCAQMRHAHADDPLSRNARHQPGLKITVGGVGQRKEPRADVGGGLRIGLAACHRLFPLPNAAMCRSSASKKAVSCCPPSSAWFTCTENGSRMQLPAAKNLPNMKRGLLSAG